MAAGKSNFLAPTHRQQQEMEMESGVVSGEGKGQRGTVHTVLQFLKSCCARAI